jgi:carotenoid cleavage dioxygenase
VFHPLNAYEQGNKIVVDVCRMEDTMKPGSSSPPMLYRWVIDQDKGTVTETQLDDRVVDFSRVCDTVVGLKNRYGYTAAFSSDGPFAEGFVKYDLEKGNSQFHDLNGGQGSEPVFVKDPAGSSEDDGWVLSYVHQPATNTSEIVIVDSRSFDKEPIARIHIPARVPAGFHGNWIPDGY